jgi:hypothetical protein
MLFDYNQVHSEVVPHAECIRLQSKESDELPPSSVVPIGKVKCADELVRSSLVLIDYKHNSRRSLKGVASPHRWFRPGLIK